MDEETVDKLRAAFQGASAGDVQAAIMASKYAGSVRDADALAAYVVGLVSGDIEPAAP